jgi:hypothetical protein
MDDFAIILFTFFLVVFTPIFLFIRRGRKIRKLEKELSLQREQIFQIAAQVRDLQGSHSKAHSPNIPEDDAPVADFGMGTGTSLEPSEEASARLAGEKIPSGGEEGGAESPRVKTQTTAYAREGFLQGASDRSSGAKASLPTFTWKWNQEKIFAFLGATLAIIGFIYLAVYLGTRMGAFTRFLLMAGVSGGLLGLSFPLGRFPRWQEISSISRSLSGALLLFAVFSASTLDGLKWIENTSLALGMISLGILYNLVLAGFCSKQLYAWFHMALNYLVLFLLPPEVPVLILVLGFSTGIQLLSFFRKEEVFAPFSLLMLSLYFVYFRYMDGIFPALAWVYGAFSLVAMASLLQKGPGEKKEGRVYQLILAVIWLSGSAYLGSNLWEKTLPLVLGALGGGAYLFWKTGKWSKTLHWPLEILLGGALLILGAEQGEVYWLTVLMLELGLFTYLKVSAKKETDSSALISLGSFLGGFLIVLLVSILREEGSWTPALALNRAMILLIPGLYYFHLPQWLRKTREGEWMHHGYSILIPLGVLPLAFGPGALDDPEGYWFLGIASLVLYYLGAGQKSVLQKKASYFSAFLGQLLLLWAIGDHGWDVGYLTFYHHLPLFLFTLGMALNSFWRKKLSRFDWGIFLFGAISFQGIMSIFWVVNPYFPSVMILISAVIFLLWWNFTEAKEARFMGFLYLLFFFFRHLSHGMQMETFVGIIPLRLILELSAIGVSGVYLSQGRWKASETFPGSSRTLLGVLYSSSWFFFLVVILSHSHRNILSPVLQLSAIGFLVLERRSAWKEFPLVATAYIHFLLAQLNLALNTHPGYPFLPGVLRNPWLFGLVNFSFSIGTIWFFYRHFHTFPTSQSPIFRRMGVLRDFLVKKKNLALLIPLFITLGLFLNWSLEATALTISLFVGCFLLYSTALALKENIFRHSTSLALLLSSFRLIYWDLAKSPPLAKALAFLGAGAVFILINVLYSQFKERFENEK